MKIIPVKAILLRQLCIVYLKHTTNRRKEMVFHESHLGERHRRETSIMESSDKIYLISQATREKQS